MKSANLKTKNMKEPKIKFKIFATREQLYVNDFDPVIGDNSGYVTKSCFKEVAEKPTLKGAIGWRDKKQKFDGEYLIIPCY